ncbi:MAG: carbohydrate-binding protein [Marinagarivorans sp.]|nr:carbohydrate-binding protein [Marinagarivorans sp.]
MNTTRIILAASMALALSNCDGTSDTSSTNATQSSSIVISSAITSSSSAPIQSSSAPASSAKSSSSIASSSSTPSSNSFTIEENGVGYCSAAGVIDTKHTGYKGAGFIDSENAKGAAINYSVSTKNNTQAVLTIRYANASGTARAAQVKVNDGASGTSDVSLTDTGAWTTWQTVTVDVFLNAGDNTLALVSNDDAGLVNIDSISLAGPGLAAGSSCATVASSSAAPVSSSSSSAPVIVSPPSGAKPDPSMGGYANYPGYGLATTTGGTGGETVTVSNYADLKAYAEADDQARIIKFSGTIAGPSPSGTIDRIRVRSNKTILGVGSSAKLQKITLNMKAYEGAGACEESTKDTYTPISNVIIRNIEFIGYDGFPDDSSEDPDPVRVECYSHHIWVDHNTFNYGSDGSVDIKRGSDLVTVSYNYFDSTAKTSLIGHGNNDKQDPGKLRVTFHHNVFYNNVSRTPRVRYGKVHVYNNYYNAPDLSMYRAENGGEIYAEANYVVQAKTVTEATITDGHITWTSSNHLDPATISRAKSKPKSEWFSVDNLASKPPYSDKIDAAPSSPPAAGAGKI